MFSGVPRRYDIINRLFTLRLDQRWRRAAARECLSGSPRRVLDLCAGTGDLTIRLSSDKAPETLIVGADFALPMLALAKRKAARAGAGPPFVAGDASRLPFRDGSFDAVGIAFGFRNLTYRNPGRDRHLAEILRVLVPGGRLVIVESSRPRSRVMKALSDIYMKLVVSTIGGLLSGQRGAYRYLAHSAVNYYAPQELAELLRATGFSDVTWKPFIGGIASLHVAVK